MPLRIAIFFLMLLSFATCYLQIYQTKTCNISLIKSLNNSKDFTYLNCSRNICDTWLANPYNSTCIGQIQIQTSNNWQTCMTNCCNDGTLSQTYESLHTCYNNHVQKGRFPYYLIGFSFILMSGLIGFIIYCRKGEIVKIRQTEKMKQTNYNSQCSLCPDKKLTLKTWCDHYMHVSCLANRYLKKQENYRNCPQCNEYVYNTKLYCKCCRIFMRYVGDYQLQFLGNCKQICNACYKK